MKTTEIQDLPLTPREGGEYATGNATSTSSQKRARAVHLGIGAFLLVNIIVLYILHFADRGSSSSGNAVTGEFSSSALSSTLTGSAAEATTPSKGHAVSFAADGKLVKGAGTTAYLAAATLSANKVPVQYVHFAKIGASKKVYNTNIMTYYRNSTDSIITTVSKTAGKKELAIADVDAKNVITGSIIKGLVTLSDSSAIALTTTRASDGLSDLVEVYPIVIAADQVTLGAKTFAVNKSTTNFVGRVSDSSFALSYYEPYSNVSYFQRIMVGTVADGKVAFSDSLVFGNANAATTTTFGRPQSVLNTNDRFTIPWFVDSFDATKDNRTISGAVGLCLTTASYDASAKNLTSLGDVCNTDMQPVYFVDSTQLSDTVVALVFFDRSNSFELTVATVEFSAVTGTPTFRSSFVIDEASGSFDFGAPFGFYPQPVVQALSNSRVAVSFFNPSNSGKPSVKVLKFASDLSMTAVSSALPISNNDFSIATADPKAYGSIVLDMLALETGFMVGYAGLWAGKQNQRVVLVESMGKPVGVVSKADGSDISVATSGTVDVSSGLTSGNTYYAATDGSLYTSTVATSDDYVLVNDNVVVSKDAMVGVAVSDKKIFITSQLN